MHLNIFVAMVKYFHYRVRDPSSNKIMSFDGKLKSDQCTELTARGQRCTKRCQMGLSFCWIHLLNDLNLRYKLSNDIQDLCGNFIKGLFAIKPNIQPIEGNVVFSFDELADEAAGQHGGTNICNYNSEVISKRKLTRRYRHGTAPYAIENRTTRKFEDGALRRGVGSLINHSDNPDLVNCEIVVYPDSSQRRGQLYIRSTKHIMNNTELLCNYGNEYEFNAENEKYSTNYKRFTV